MKFDTSSNMEAREIELSDTDLKAVCGGYGGDCDADDDYGYDYSYHRHHRRHHARRHNYRNNYGYDDQGNGGPCDGGDEGDGGSSSGPDLIPVMFVVPASTCGN